jgi:quercetin dioxygenase-like cupin family protein
MRLTITHISFVLLAMMAVILIGFQYSYAAEREYKPKVKATTLVETPLAGVEGKTVIIKHFELPPGHVGGKHFHSGPVFVYVLEGKLTIDTENAGRQSISAGELYQEPIGNTMQARNLSATEPTKIIVFQVGDEGKPMMIKTE